MFHMKQGDNMKWVLVQNIPINYVPAVMGDEEGRTIKFDSRHEAEKYIQEHELTPCIREDPEEIRAIPEMETIC